jgi:hypothetical protein
MAVVMAYEEQQQDALERRRQADADRQARKRDKDKSRDVTLRHSDRSLTGAGDARGEVKTSNSQIESKKENKSAQSARVSDLDEFRSTLAGSVDADRIESYVKHRRTKRGQITGHAARLFLGDAESCGLSPSEAIDACISRNWITVKPEYGIGKGRARAYPSSAPSMADVFELVGKRQGDERKSEDFSGTGAVVPYLPAFGQRRQ